MFKSNTNDETAKMGGKRERPIRRAYLGDCQSSLGVQASLMDPHDVPVHVWEWQWHRSTESHRNCQIKRVSVESDGKVIYSNPSVRTEVGDVHTGRKMNLSESFTNSDSVDLRNCWMAADIEQEKSQTAINIIVTLTPTVRISLRVSTKRMAKLAKTLKTTRIVYK